jgi:hypothetical protein
MTVDKLLKETTNSLREEPTTKGKRIMFRRRLASSLTVLVALTAAVLSAPAPAGAHVADHQKIAIPLYVGPDTASGELMFQRLAQNTPTNDITVINGSNSGPQVPFNLAWANAIKKVHDGGPMVLAYVDTGYYGFAFPPYPAHATRPDGPGGGSTSTSAWTAQIEADVDAWYDLYGSYGVDGIFLDESVEPCGTVANPSLYVDLYAAISDYISAHHPEAYNVPSQTDMQTVISRSRQQNAGYVYVTDDTITYDGQGNITGFPWDTIASYWNNELLTAANVSDNSAPTSPYALAGTGLSGTTTAKVNLTWNNGGDNVATIDYEVQVKNGTSWTSAGWFYNNGATVTGLLPSHTYQFKVRARDEVNLISSWTSTITATTPAAAAHPILNTSACLSPTIATYQANYVDPVQYRRVFINSDNNTATGYNLGTPGAGMDYMIENSLFYRYSGTGEWNWGNPIAGVSPLVSSTNDVYKWQVPTSAFSGAATTNVVVFENYAPEYSAPTLTINQTTSC